MSEYSPITVTEAIAWFAEMFETTADSISASTMKEDIDAWDSMGVLTLMAELDDRFEINLSTDELESLASIDDLLQVLKRHNVLNE